MDYNVFYESRGKSLLSCKINNVDCIVKRVKQHEGVKSILSLYLPSDNPDYCFTLKGTCLGTMLRNGQVDQVDIFQFVKDLLGTLVLLERGNITHNDIKPDNIVLYDGHWFLIDYELSKSFKLKRGKYFDCNNGKLRCERFSRGYRPPYSSCENILLDASESYSTDGKQISYKWEIVSSNMMTLPNNNSSKLSITYDSINAGSHTFKLTTRSQILKTSSSKQVTFQKLNYATPVISIEGSDSLSLSTRKN
ncbi:predicted protein [Naegleria gruberi]|uniref:Predicted protein n=1 Tax=Naegleria gruberi TaxID=5762 RepID=D2VNC8_NAEGR|nr:uncharacterized protein NAEGRDRAFT_70450 [Naegleria gruberi]EFC41715.1 predicted protein [Naegleria gruberi]|eukprot:XP_002674459.1 predicted protein [Naegleria gruberi strain NEG-M]